MASTVELENLVVRVSADVEALLKGLEQVRQASTQTAEHAAKAGTKIEAMTEHLKEFSEMVTRGLGVLGIAGEFREAFEAFEQYEMGVIRMNAMLEANGREVQATLKDYKAFAEQMAQSTLATRGEVMELLKLAESYDLTGASAQRAAKEAMALKEFSSGSAQAMISLTASMNKGDIERAMHYARAVRQLRNIQDEAKFVEEYEKLVASGMHVMAEEAQTVSGRLENAKKNMQAFNKEIGAAIAEGITPAVDYLKGLAEDFNNLDKPTRARIADTIALTAAVTALIAVLPYLRSGWNTIISSPLTWFTLATLAARELAVEIMSSTQAYKDSKVAVDDLAAATKNLIEAQNQASGKFIREHRLDQPALQKQLKLEEQHLQDMKNDLINRQKDLEREKYGAHKEFGLVGKSPLIRGLGALGSFITGGTSTEKDLKAMIKSLEDDSKSAEERVKALRNALENISPQSVSEQVNTLVTKLKEEADTIGMSAQEVEVYKMAKMGLSNIRQREVYEMIQSNEERKKEVELEKQLEEMMFDLRMKREGIGVDYYNESLEKMLYTIQQVKPAMADAAREQDRHTKILQEGYETAQKFADPADKFAKEQKKLFDQLMAGAFGWDVYNRAVQKTAESLHEAAAAGRDAAGLGSAEFRSRMYAYSQGLSNILGTRNLPGGAQLGPMPGVVPHEQGPVPREVAPWNDPGRPGVPPSVGNGLLEVRDEVKKMNSPGSYLEQMARVISRWSGIPLVADPVDLED